MGAPMWAGVLLQPLPTLGWCCLGFVRVKGWRIGDRIWGGSIAEGLRVIRVLLLLSRAVG